MEDDKRTPPATRSSKPLDEGASTSRDMKPGASSEGSQPQQGPARELAEGIQAPSVREQQEATTAQAKSDASASALGSSVEGIAATSSTGSGTEAGSAGSSASQDVPEEKEAAKKILEPVKKGRITLVLMDDCLEQVNNAAAECYDSCIEVFEKFGIETKIDEKTKLHVLVDYEDPPEIPALKERLKVIDKYLESVSLALPLPLTAPGSPEQEAKAAPKREGEGSAEDETERKKRKTDSDVSTEASKEGEGSQGAEKPAEAAMECSGSEGCPVPQEQLEKEPSEVSSSLSSTTEVSQTDPGPHSTLSSTTASSRWLLEHGRAGYGFTSTLSGTSASSIWLEEHTKPPSLIVSTVSSGSDVEMPSPGTVRADQGGAAEQGAAGQEVAEPVAGPSRMPTAPPPMSMRQRATLYRLSSTTDQTLSKVKFACDFLLISAKGASHVVANTLYPLYLRPMMLELAESALDAGTFVTVENSMRMLTQSVGLAVEAAEVAVRFHLSIWSCLTRTGSASVADRYGRLSEEALCQVISAAEQIAEFEDIEAGGVDMTVVAEKQRLVEDLARILSPVLREVRESPAFPKDTVTKAERSLLYQAMEAAAKAATVYTLFVIQQTRSVLRLLLDSKADPSAPEAARGEPDGGHGSVPKDHKTGKGKAPSSGSSKGGDDGAKA